MPGAPIGSPTEPTAVKGETVLINELIPQIDARWRTLAARESRGWRALAWAPQEPSGSRRSILTVLFGRAGERGLYSLEEMKASHADQLARLWADEAAWEADSVWALAEKNAEALRTQVRVRQVVGAQDSLLEANRRLHALITQRLRSRWTMTNCPASTTIRAPSSRDAAWRAGNSTARGSPEEMNDPTTTNNRRAREPTPPPAANGRKPPAQSAGHPCLCGRSHRGENQHRCFQL